MSRRPARRNSRGSQLSFVGLSTAKRSKREREREKKNREKLDFHRHMRADALREAEREGVKKEKHEKAAVGRTQCERDFSGGLADDWTVTPWLPFEENEKIRSEPLDMMQLHDATAKLESMVVAPADERLKLQ